MLTSQKSGYHLSHVKLGVKMTFHLVLFWQDAFWSTALLCMGQHTYNSLQSSNTAADLLLMHAQVHQAY